MMKKLDKDIFIGYAQQLGIRTKVAHELFKLVIADNNQPATKPKKRMPKLEAILNPGSKHYDSTSGLTTKLSLVFHTHQHKQKRYHHKRITSEDRQWVILVHIKLAITEVTGTNTRNFMTCAKQVLTEAERISKSFGKNNLYLAFVLSRIGELLDTVGIKSTSVITTRENRLYRAYRIRRKKVSGSKSMLTDMEAGSVEHNFIRQMALICRKYKVKAKLFMNIQFAAFAQFDSFPALKDLVTSKAIDRLERGLMKYRKDSLGKEDDAYWREIENKSGR